MYLILLSNNEKEILLGGGIVNKISNILFETNFMKSIFIYLSFFISWLIILIYTNNNLKDKLIIIYFFIISILAFPLYQEYFDPIIYFMVFTFFGSKIFVNYKNSIFLFLYFAIFLISSNFYYYNLLN